MPTGIYKRTEENRTGFQKGHSVFVGAEKGWFKKGQVAPNKGKKCPEIGLRQLGVLNHRYGKKNSLLMRKKQSESLKDSPYKGKLKGRFGEKSNAYKGGITPENHLIRTSLEMKLWRKACMERDIFTDQKTGISGGYLQVHHINNFSSFPELRFALDNGITLSKESHKEFHHKYGTKNNTREQLLEFLNTK